MGFDNVLPCDSQNLQHFLDAVSFDFSIGGRPCTRFDLDEGLGQRGFRYPVYVDVKQHVRAAIADASAAADPEGRMPRVTCSVGVANFPADGATTDQLLKAADRALYEAKDAGRNCVRLRRAA
jgi:GGDEF domain-containing protein